MRKFFPAAAVLLLVAACAAPQNGLFVSPTAEPVGGNLFIETLDDGSQVLVLDGEITPDTSFAFQALVESAEVDGLIIAQSPGGNLIAAHQIGRSIEANKINTAVLISCRSACVDVFIAGQARAIAQEGELGLHAASDREFGLSVDRPYWQSFGLGAVNEAAYQIPFGDIWIVSPQRAVELRLATEILS